MTWLGMIIVALLAMPTGLMVILISAIWSLTDRAAQWLNRR